MQSRLKLLALMLCVSLSASAQIAPLPEADHSTIEYDTVSNALSALRAKPGVEISEQGGWTIAYEPALNVVWSFAPPGHASYPSVVKRTVVLSGGATFLRMDVKCGASKSACDELVREFIRLNGNVRSTMQAGSAAVQH